MFGLLRKFGWIGGLIAISRTPVGRQATAKIKAVFDDPDNRRKFRELRSKLMSVGRKAAHAD